MQSVHQVESHQEKHDVDHIEKAGVTDDIAVVTAEGAGLMKSRFDEMSIPKTLWVFRRVVLVTLAVYTGYMCEGFEVCLTLDQSAAQLMVSLALAARSLRIVASLRSLVPEAAMATSETLILLGVSLKPWERARLRLTRSIVLERPACLFPRPANARHADGQNVGQMVTFTYISW